MIKKKELTKEVGHHLDKGVDLPDPILHSPTRLISASMGLQGQALPHHLFRIDILVLQILFTFFSNLHVFHKHSAHVKDIGTNAQILSKTSCQKEKPETTVSYILQGMGMKLVF